MKTLLITLFLVLTFSCAKNPEAPIIRSSQMMSTLRWDTSALPLDIKIGDAFTPDAQSLITQMMTVWETETRIDFFQEPTITPNKYFANLEDYYYKDSSVMGIYLADQPVKGMGPDYLAVAQVFFEPAIDEFGRRFLKITHADVVVNGYDYPMSTDPNCSRTYYLGTLLLHELGHVLGEDHVGDGVMTDHGMSTEDNLVDLNDTEVNTLLIKYLPPTQNNAITGPVQYDLSVDQKAGKLLFHMRAL